MKLLNSETVLLETRGVSKKFEGLPALSNINFKISPRSICSIIGPNGAGKTTFFNLISGFYKLTSGEIYFKNQRIDNFKGNRIAKLGISRTFQNIRLFDQMTVLENVMVGCHCRTKGGLCKTFLRPPFYRLKEERSIKNRALELLHFVGLDEKDQLASSLSLSKQRRLEIARALATDPELLLLDECASGMDSVEKSEIIDLIRKLNSQGKTILLIEHDMNLVMDTSDRITVLNFGVIIAEGTPETIQNHPEVIKAYLGISR